MNDSIGKLPPIRLTDEDQAKTTADIRRRAIERQTRTVEDAPVPESIIESGSRRIYPSDRERRQRTVTITLPEQELMDYLKNEADRLSSEGHEEMTPTRLATLILVAGIEQWQQGKLKVTKEATPVETTVIRPVEGSDKK